MNDDLKDILSNMSPDIDQETLLRYLQGKLSSLEQHELEKQIQDSDFDTDALEGLEQFKDKQKIAALVAQLKRDLKSKTEKKKALKKRSELHLDTWTIVAIVLVLTLIVISYFIIHHMVH